MSTHYLYLTNEKLVSLTSGGKRFTARREFEISGNGADEFERHLAGLRTLPTHLLVDLAEEDFRLDTIAHLGGKDRAAVLARRLTQVFRGATYRQAIVQGREAEGRRDDRVIYAAITNAEILRPWMEILERLEVPLLGVNSVAVFSGELLKALGLEFPHTLLVTLSPGGALRQTYFKGEEVKFTRLASDLLQDGLTLGEAIAEETTRTWQYLDNLRSFAASDLLEVCVVCHPKDKSIVAPALRGFAQMQYRVLDSEQVAQKLGLKPPPVGSSAEELFVHLFAAKPAPNFYATPEQRRFGVLRNARNSLRAAGAVTLAAAVVWGGINLFAALQNRSRDADVEGETADLTRQAQLVERNMPEQGVAGETMRDSVALYNMLLKDSPSMLAFLVPVSRIVSAHPRVKLVQISWLASADGKATPVIKPSTSRVPPSVKSVAKQGDGNPGAPPQPAPGPAPGELAGGRFQTATIEAMVAAFDGDYRAALAEVDRFVAALNAIPGYEATLTESPLDTKPGASISARFGGRSDGTGEGRFVVRVSNAPGGRT
jgi:hypothetical protein